MTESKEWKEIPEHEKEEVLRAQRVEKWVMDVFDMWKYFNQERVKALEEITIRLGGFENLVWQDFQKAMREARRYDTNTKRFTTTLFARLCGVNKSTISRYLRFHDAAPFYDPENPYPSQRAGEEDQRAGKAIMVFQHMLNNGATFRNLSQLMNDLGFKYRWGDIRAGWGRWFVSWLTLQDEEVQERIEKEMGIDEASLKRDKEFAEIFDCDDCTEKQKKAP